MERANNPPLNREEAKQIIEKYFCGATDGSDYYQLVPYLKSEDVVIPKNPLIIGSMISGLEQQNRIKRIWVSGEVYTQLYGKEPKGEKVKGRYRIYSSPNNVSLIEKIEQLEKIEEIKAKIKLGITPYLSQKIIDHRLFEILQELSRNKEVLGEVVLGRLKQYEIDVRKIQEDAYATIENVVVDTITEIGKTYTVLEKELNDLFKNVSDTRKKLNETTNSKNTPA